MSDPFLDLLLIAGTLAGFFAILGGVSLMIERLWYDR